MALEQRLNLRLAQRLVLTPTLQAAIKLLQMTRLQLTEKIAEELEQNPCLDETALQRDEADAAESKETDDKAAEDDFDYEAFFRDYLEDSARPRIAREERELPSFEATLASQPGLSEHLLWQLGMERFSSRQQEIGQAIIGNINEDGYLQADLADICGMGSFEEGEVLDVLSKVQRFDPVGVAARDLRECMLIQLETLKLGDPILLDLVRDSLHLLENRKFKELQDRYGLTSRELEERWDILRQLDPRPGARYNHEPCQYVTPDVFVYKVGDEYVVRLNEDGIPRLRISSVYRRMLRQSSSGKEAKSYVRERFKSALWLIKSVEQRQRTIFKVATSIIKQQRGFFDQGVSALRPMVLKDVARDIEMHESTVSRVVTNKYMHTPRGVLEMKFFFQGAIESSQGAAVSSLAVKHKVRKLIDGEDPRRPLSDAKIVAELKKEGLKIARRTIAKYRETMKIPSSSRRRRIR